MLKDASSFASHVDGTFFFILIVSIIFFVGLVATMIFFVVRYHHTKNKKVANIEGNATLEVVWTVIPTFLVMAMFYYGFIGYKDMRNVPDDAINIKASARMWSWTFTYENGYQSTTLTVPLGKAVKTEVVSEDVLHSFYIPAFRIKQDAVPGYDTYAWFRAIEAGTYNIYCAEFCGDRHSYMLSTVDVLPEEQYNEWYASVGVESEQIKTNLPAYGKELVALKGCTACHSLDGSPLISPSFKGLYGKTETVLAEGGEREVLVDDAYLINAIKVPDAEKVKGFENIPMPVMPLSDEEMNAIIEYIKSIQ